MAEKTWEELVVWKLEGARFDEHHGVDVRDLDGLVHLRAALVDVAKAFWKRTHGKQRVPDHVEEQVDIRVQTFVDGCVQTTLWLGKPPPPSGTQLDLAGERPDPTSSFFESLHEAAGELEDLIDALRTDQPLPDWLPAETISNVHKMARRLRPDESVTVRAARPRRRAATHGLLVPVAARTSTSGTEPVGGTPPAEEAAPVSPTVRGLLDAALRARLAEMSARVEKQLEEDRVVSRTLSGEVRMVDLDGEARLHPDGDPYHGSISVTFEPADEEKVSTALQRHQSIRLRVRGDARLDARGRIKSFAAKRIALIEAPVPDAPSEGLFERLAEDEPAKLIAMIRSGELRPGLLTFAAEILGRHVRSAEVVEVLRTLAQHPSAAVREGSVYGLAFQEGITVDDQLKKLAESDPSPGVRAAAAGALAAR